ncbi:hypothetical protein NDI54_02040 [Haloarcula sp. S1AR25-5A]|uniref:Uncharacterized protein n=1 Tax=Haloarcula terrestris TaxID=2950533 RepID=A0AAE4EVQ8_9EURY|nr:hypothetical protein [Haloarcula terrestris]MDS0220127.1 hypothetical protein [Haloarcula terrestris]
MGDRAQTPGERGDRYVRSDARDAWVVVRTELRARVRQTLETPRQLVSVAVLLLLVGILLPLFGVGAALSYGASLASGPPPVGRTGVLVAAAMGAGLYLGFSTAFQQLQLGTLSPLVRTAVPPRAVVVGRLTSELTQALVFVVLPAGLLLPAVAIGARNPIPAVLLALGLVPALLGSAFAGRLLGEGLAFANRWLGVSTWTKGAAILAATAAAYLGTQMWLESVFPDSSGTATEAGLQTIVPGAPLQAYASVILAPVGAQIRPLGLVVGAVLVAAVPLALAATVRFESWLLQREPEADRDGTGHADESRPVAAPFRATSATRVAWRYLLRTRRDPAMLAHLFPIFVGSLGILSTAATDLDTALWLAPGTAVIVGAALAGGAYCLNPLGDDRNQLPLVLTSTGSTAMVLRGRALAGITLGLLFAWGLAVPLELADGSGTHTVALALFAPILLLAGAGTALGMGALVPKFERSEYLNVERAHPSLLVSIGYMLGSIPVGIIGLVLFPTAVGDPSALHLAALGTYVLVIGAIGLAGYAAAVRRFDRLTLDDI